MIAIITLVSFLLGVGLASFTSLPVGILYGTLLGCLLSFIYIYLLRSEMGRQRRVLIIVLSILFITLGVLRFHYHVDHLNHNPFQSNRIDDSYTFVIIEPPRTTATQVRAVGTTGDYKALLVFERGTPVKYGDKVRLTGKPELPEAFTSETGVVFDYRSYLLANGVTHIIEAKEFEIISSDHAPLIRKWLYDVRSKLTQAIGKLLPEPQAGLLSGILIGDKDGLSDELEDRMINVGVIHIAVFSGQNVAILSVILFAILGFLPYRLRLSACFLSIVAFILISGAEPPAIRAGIFATIALLSQVVHREMASGRVLLLAASLMVLWNPLSLGYNISFQLSFMAMIGIMYVAPIIERVIEEKFAWITKQYGLRYLVSATIGAQIAVLPLLLHMSGNFSPWSLPANLLILPMITPLMFVALVGSFAQAVISLFSNIIIIPLGWVLHFCTSYIVLIVNLFSDVGGAMTIHLNTSWMLLFYLTLFGAIFWLQRIFPPKATN